MSKKSLKNKIKNNNNIGDATQKLATMRIKGTNEEWLEKRTCLSAIVAYLLTS